MLSVNDSDLYDPSKWVSPHRHFVLRMWFKRLLRRADMLVRQSRDTIENAHTYHDPSLPVERILLEIRRPKMDVAARADYGFTEDKVLLVTVGRLVARKAMDELSSVLEDTDRPDAHLVIIGSGPQEQALRQKAGELDLTDRVHFMGQTDERDKFRLLQISDTLVSTRQHEGFGLVYLEAMAWGLPVICYDYGGQTDFLTDGITGHVVPLNDTALFTDCCRRLISDWEPNRRISAGNRARVEGLYTNNCTK